MKQHEIDGKKVVYEFIVLHKGWEMDNEGWVTEDGRMWCTNHGGLYEMGATELHEFIDTTTKSLNQLLAVSELCKIIKRVK